MRIEGNEAIFSSGRQSTAVHGIIGIDAELEVHQGYDDGFYLYDYEKKEALSPADLQELADYMIDLWTQFKQKCGGQQV